MLERRKFLQLITLSSVGLLLKEPGGLPSSCFTDGIVDLRKCSNFREIPIEILNKGYINLAGIYEPYLPKEELVYLNAGNYLAGDNIFAMDEKYAQWRKNLLAPEWDGLNPNDYTGTIALATAAYVNTAVWIQNSKTGYIEGPLLDIEYSAPAHIRQYLCDGAIADVSRNAYDRITNNQSGPTQVRIIVQSSKNLTQPDFNSVDSNVYVNLAEIWLEQDGWTC